MHIVEFPGCCTARALVSFGQERHSAYGEVVNNVNQGELNMLLKPLKRGGKGLIVAILTDRQTKGVELLLKNGFTQTPWVKKEQHRDSKIAVFTLDLTKWEPVGEVGDGWIRNRGCKGVPRKARGKRVKVRLRNGLAIPVSAPASDLYWGMDGHVGDIMQYKIMGDV